MGKLCCVRKCPNSTGKPKSTIHNFPTLQSLRDLWLVSLGDKMKPVNPINCGVCSNHFGFQDYFNSAGVLGDLTNKKKRCLRPSAIPTPTILDSTPIIPLTGYNKTKIDSLNILHKSNRKVKRPKNTRYTIFCILLLSEQMEVDTEETERLVPDENFDNLAYITKLETDLTTAKLLNRTKTQVIHVKDKLIGELRDTVSQLYFQKCLWITVCRTATVPERLLLLLF